MVFTGLHQHLWRSSRLTQLDVVGWKYPVSTSSAQLFRAGLVVYLGVFLRLAGVQRPHGFKVKCHRFPRLEDQPVCLCNTVDRRVAVQAIDVSGQQLTPPLKRLTALADVARGTGGHHVANGVICRALGYALICQPNDGSNWSACQRSPSSHPQYAHRPANFALSSMRVSSATSRRRFHSVEPSYGS